MVDARTSDVVVVVVRDNQGLNLVNVPPMLSHSQLSLSPANTCIEQQPSVGGLHIDAIAV
jgi:hypothetical protein